MKVAVHVFVQERSPKREMARVSPLIDSLFGFGIGCGVALRLHIYKLIHNLRRRNCIHFSIEARRELNQFPGLYEPEALHDFT